MRIAYIYSKLPPIEDGGADYLDHLAIEMVVAGHDVGVFTTDDENIRSRYKTGSANSYKVYPVVSNWRLPFFSNNSSWKSIRSALENFQPEIIHIIFPDSTRLNDYQIPFLIPYVVNIPVVTIFFSFFVSNSNLFSKVGVLGLFLASKRIVVHTGYLRELMNRYLPFWGAKTRIVPVGNNLADEGLSTTSRIKMRNELGISEESFVVGFYGGIDPSKGIEDLLRAFELLIDLGEDVDLLFVGGRTWKSEYAKQIESQIASLHLDSHIKYSGYVDRSKVVDYLLTCDVCALPFRKNVLGRSSLISCLFFGIPTITSYFPSEGEFLVDRENVYLVPPGNAKELSNAILELKNNPKLREKISRGAKELSVEFTWGKIAARMEAIYKEIIE